MIYVASPFTHKDKNIEVNRYLAVSAYVHERLNEGEFAYSPIAYCFPLHRLHALPGDAEFWKAFNEDFLSKADEMHVLMMKGWKESKGVQHEINYWLDNCKQGQTLRYVNFKGD
jgi:hypothetical protein